MMRRVVVIAACAAAIGFAGEAAASEARLNTIAVPVAFAESLSIVSSEDAQPTQEVCSRRFGFRGHRRLILEPRICRPVFSARLASYDAAVSSETCAIRQIVRGRRRDWRQCTSVD